MSPPSAAPSVRIVGRYAIHDPIASGGMGTVSLGRLLGPMGFSRTVAIKQVRREYGGDAELARMFLDELRLAARIDHPNVAAVLDVVATDGELFLVMEYVAGESLARLLQAVETAGQRAPLPVITTILTGVLHGLHAAHEATDERGVPLCIVHRDVSPENILVGVDGVARVIDFGVARAAVRLQRTEPGQLKGKLAYTSPEQLAGERATRAADVYAAGLVLWELVAGRRVFLSEGVLSSGRVKDGSRTPPSKYAWSGNAKTFRDDELKSLERMDAIILRAVSASPEQRYASASDMALALEASFPLAPQSTVGQWVEGLAKTALAKRASRVRALEEASVGGSPPAEPPRTSVAPTSGKLLRAGDSAPDIDAVATSGHRYTLSASRKALTVIFFFPMAFTPGCTREVGLFRDSYTELILAGVDVVGVSTDGHKTQCKFAASMNVTFPMIADEAGTISRAYGVLWPVLGKAKRVTFIVDRKRKILATFQHELRIKKHRDEVLRYVDEFVRARGAQG